jgi:hypothetical protein
MSRPFAAGLSREVAFEEDAPATWSATRET